MDQSDYTRLRLIRPLTRAVLISACVCQNSMPESSLPRRHPDRGDRNEPDCGFQRKSNADCLHYRVVYDRKRHVGPGSNAIADAGARGAANAAAAIYSTPRLRSAKHQTRIE